MQRTQFTIWMLDAFWTGARISQLLAIRGEDIFEQEGKWVIMIRAAKRGNVVVQPLPAYGFRCGIRHDAIDRIGETKGRSLVFGSLSRQYYNLCLKRYAEVAGIHSAFAHTMCSVTVPRWWSSMLRSASAHQPVFGHK